MAADQTQLRAALAGALPLADAPPQLPVALDRDGLRWTVDLARPLPIAIPLQFNRAQPSAFGLPPASAAAVVSDGFVGDTRRGGAVNCDTLRLTPHGNGTHSECVGHLVDDAPPIGELLDELLMPARLVSVRPRPLGKSHERYAEVARPDDLVVTRRELSRALLVPPPDDACELDVHTPIRALVIRTLPNDGGKRRRHYEGSNPPYLTVDAVRYIRALGVEHLLIDVPSADREDDAGLLPAHREFWGLRAHIHKLEAAPSRRTITEMIFVPDEIADGWYLLNIQIPHFAGDAAPSRPILYAVENVISIGFNELRHAR